MEFNLIMGHLLFFFYCCLGSCIHFHHTTAPHTMHHWLPPLNLTPLALSICPLYMFLDSPSPILFYCPSSHFSMVTVSLFVILICWLYFACSFVCWLGSTYRWDHMLCIFHCLAHFTYHNALQFHPCCHKGQKLLLSFCCILFHFLMYIYFNYFIVQVQLSLPQ